MFCAWELRPRGEHIRIYTLITSHPDRLLTKGELIRVQGAPRFVMLVG